MERVRVGSRVVGQISDGTYSKRSRQCWRPRGYAFSEPELAAMRRASVERIEVTDTETKRRYLAEASSSCLVSVRFGQDEQRLMPLSRFREVNTAQLPLL